MPLERLPERDDEARGRDDDRVLEAMRSRYPRGRNRSGLTRVRRAL